MSKKLQSGLQFYTVECSVSTPKKTLSVHCITYIDSNRTSKLYKADRLVVVPYAERLERSLNSALDAYFCRCDFGVATVKVRPIDGIDTGITCDCAYLRPSAKIISTHLMSMFMSKLYNLITDNNNNILNK